MDVAITGPAEGDLFQFGPVRLRILEDGSTTDHRLGMAEINLPPHTDGPPQHRHARHDEGFYVVFGTARFTVGTAVHDAPTGTLVMVPPGAPHTFANPFDEPAVLLNTFTPDLYVQYFRDLRQMIAAGRPLTPQAAIETMARYATEPVGPSGPADEESVRQVLLDPDLPVTLREAGHGRPVLLLHGGGGGTTVASIAAHLAESTRVITPTHPGWDGTPRPERLASVADLADAYTRLLEVEDLRDVVIVGSSVGGWLAAEMALRDTDGRIAGLVLVDAVGARVDGEPIRDFFALDARGIAEYAYHDGERFFVDPATLPPEVGARMRANVHTLRAVAGASMDDPTLLGRLAAIRLRTLLIWGASDRIVTPAYGRAMAAAFADSRLHVVPEAGHLPHVERPDSVFALLDLFLAEAGADSPRGTAPPAPSSND